MSQIIEPYPVYARIPSNFTERMRHSAGRKWVSVYISEDQVITDVDPARSVCDLRSTFGVMLALAAQVMMLGLAYASCTSFHFAEWLSQVPYRQTIDLSVKVRQTNGSITRQAMIDYQPHTYSGTHKPDFNCLGKMLEEQGRVTITSIGNAVARRVAMRDLISLAQLEAEKDYNIFRAAGGEAAGSTRLASGKTVVSPEMLDGAGRADHYEGSVLDEAELSITSSRSWSKS